ncbi:hypothetical protein Tco_0036378, partial [Tanacetum coccineum]
VFANMRRQGKDFSGTVTPLFATILIQPQGDVGEVDETIYEEREDSVERAATTATSLDAEQGSGNINRTQSMAIPNDPFPQGIGLSGSPRRQDTIGDRPAKTRFERLSKQSNEPPLSRVNTLRSREDSIKLQELMDLCTKLSDKVLDLENIKNAQALEIQKLNKDAQVTTVGVSVSTIEPSTHPTTTTTTTTLIKDEDLNIAQTLMKIKSKKSKAKGVTMQNPSERKDG